MLRLSGETTTFFFSQAECLYLFILLFLISGCHLMTAVVTKCGQPWRPRFMAPRDATHAHLGHRAPRRCITYSAICPACAGTHNHAILARPCDLFTDKILSTRNVLGHWEIIFMAGETLKPCINKICNLTKFIAASTTSLY